MHSNEDQYTVTWNSTQGQYRDGKQYTLLGIPDLPYNQTATKLN